MTSAEAPRSDSASPPANHLAVSAPVIITIDGPAGTGKSSVARELAKRLRLDFLDTGAMYRAAAAIVIDRRLTLGDDASVVAAVAEADLHFDWTSDPPKMLAWVAPIDHRLRQEDVESIVSQVAAIGPLRQHMVRKQRLIARQHPRLVTEGRDQGSVVFPDAAVKFYIDAPARVRAQRRAEQLRAQGEDVDLVELEREMAERDQRDSTRLDGPLTCPDDAVRIDTSNLSRQAVVDQLERIARSRVPAIR